MSGGGTAPGLWAGIAARLPRPTIAFNPRAVSLAEGLRAAIAIGAMVALHDWLDQPLALQAALAALFTCLCDAGGPVRQRIPGLLAFAVLGPLTTAIFGLARGLGYPVIPFAAAGIFCAGFARVYGQAALQAGNLLAVVLVLALDRPLAGLADASAQGGAFLVGSLWAVLLTLVIWRLHPFLPARRAVAEVYRALADLVGDQRRLLRDPTPAPGAWDRHAATYRRAVRIAIEAARVTVSDTLRARGGQSPRAAQSLIRLETAEQIFTYLIVLEELLERDASPPVVAAAEAMLRRLRPVLRLLARFIVTDAPTGLARLADAADAIAAAANAAGAQQLGRIAGPIGERLRIAVTLAAPATLGTDLAAGGTRPPFRLLLLGPLQANLDWRSAVLRHAARAALVAIPGLAITFAWPGPYQHWLTITMVVTMQPYVAITIQRALERVGGTVLGGLLAAAISLLCRTPLAMSLALFPLAVAALAVRAVSFGLFMAMLTPLIVLLSELGRPGTSEFEIAAMRALYTLIGGGLAVAGNLLLWPSWEPVRLRNELAAALAAHRRHAAADLAFVLGEASTEAAEAARREAGIASNNLETSLARAMQEPRRSAGKAELDTALVVDAALRRLAARLLAIRIDAGTLTAGDAAAQRLRAWRDWIDAALADLAAGRLAELPPHPSPTGSALDGGLSRIARQIELLAGALGQGEG